jgi:hypothetical protein
MAKHVRVSSEISFKPDFMLSLLGLVDLRDSVNVDVRDSLRYFHRVQSNIFFPSNRAPTHCYADIEASRYRARDALATLADNWSSFARTSLWHAREHFRVPIALEDPPSGNHLVEDRQAGRISVIRRPTHSVVVESIEGNSSTRAKSVEVR